MTTNQRIGYLSAVLAFAAWGFYPLFFKQLAGFDIADVVAHRILWSFVLLLIGFVATSRLRQALRYLRELRCLRNVALSTVLLSINWACFVHAINTDRVLESSLGYFLLPVVNAIFGVVFFKERLNRLKTAAVVVAGGGMAMVFIVAEIVPLLSLALALSFGAYGMMRKRSDLDSATGLFLETLALCPFALAYVLLAGADMTSRGASGAVLLMLSGAVTIFPLFAMVIAARRIEFNVLGFLQYLTPIGHFLIAVLVYDEAISLGYGLAFATTWVAIALYSAGLIGSRKTESIHPRQSESS
ncbi:MAG: EamA family transporter RarD [bacterium]